MKRKVKSEEEKRVEHIARVRAWQRVNKVRYLSRKKQWQLMHPDYMRQYMREWRERNPNYKRNNKGYRGITPSTSRLAQERRARLKQETLTYYGNGKCACVWCGFSDIRALSLDHIDDNGAEERRSLRNRPGGVAFYTRLRDLHFPNGYQTLCMNCQWIKDIERRKRNSIYASFMRKQPRLL